jgi:hypothetical protein
VATPDKLHDRRTLKRKLMGWMFRIRSAGLKPVQWLAILVITVGVIYLSFFFFQVSVCDDQVTNAGKVAGVCRHPQLYDPPVAVVGLVILSFLGVFFSEISGFGISLKTLKTQIEEARRDAGEARRYALDSLLAAKYNQTRATIPPGEERDKEMDALFNEMKATLRGKGSRDFDLRGHLKNRDDDGMRLAGYAYLCANPGHAWTPDLVDAVLQDPAHFNEEMGLKALRHALQGNCGQLDDDLRAELKARAEKHSKRARSKNRESGRAKEIDAILKQCPE